MTTREYDFISTTNKEKELVVDLFRNIYFSCTSIWDLQQPFNDDSVVIELLEELHHNVLFSREVELHCESIFEIIAYHYGGNYKQFYENEIQFLEESGFDFLPAPANIIQEMVEFDNDEIPQDLDYDLCKYPIYERGDNMTSSTSLIESGLALTEIIELLVTKGFCVKKEESLQVRVDFLNTQLESKMKIIDDLEAQVANLEDSNKKLKSQNFAKTKEVVELKKKVQDLQKVPVENETPKEVKETVKIQDTQKKVLPKQKEKVSQKINKTENKEVDNKKSQIQQLVEKARSKKTSEQTPDVSREIEEKIISDEKPKASPGMVTALGMVKDNKKSFYLTKKFHGELKENYVWNLKGELRDWFSTYIAPSKKKRKGKKAITTTGCLLSLIVEKKSLEGKREFSDDYLYFEDSSQSKPREKDVQEQLVKFARLGRDKKCLSTLSGMVKKARIEICKAYGWNPNPTNKKKAHAMLETAYNIGVKEAKKLAELTA